MDDTVGRAVLPRQLREVAGERPGDRLRRTKRRACSRGRRTSPGIGARVEIDADCVSACPIERSGDGRAEVAAPPVIQIFFPASECQAGEGETGVFGVPSFESKRVEVRRLHHEAELDGLSGEGARDVGRR
jgi:hypothetical protein